MDPVLLKYYLGMNGNCENVLLLFERRLVVIFKGTITEYSFEQVRGLSLVRKKLIIPLVIGGIGTCLSWLSLSLSWYHYHLNLFMVFAFFGWMYYGFIGKDALEITEGKHSQVYLIQANHHVLNSFLKFVKQKIWLSRQPIRNVTYHLTHKSDWERQEQSEFYVHDSLQSEGFIHTSYAAEVIASHEKYFEPTDKLVLLGISMAHVESKVEIPFVKPPNASFPHIHGKLNKTAIIMMKSINALEDIYKVLNLNV